MVAKSGMRTGDAALRLARSVRSVLVDDGFANSRPGEFTRAGGRPPRYTVVKLRGTKAGYDDIHGGGVGVELGIASQPSWAAATTQDLIYVLGPGALRERFVAITNAIVTRALARAARTAAERDAMMTGTMCADWRENYFSGWPLRYYIEDDLAEWAGFLVDALPPAIRHVDVGRVEGPNLLLPHLHRAP